MVLPRVEIVDYPIVTHSHTIVGRSRHTIVRKGTQVRTHLVYSLLDPPPHFRRKSQKVGIKIPMINLQRAAQVLIGSAVGCYRTRGFAPASIASRERAIFALNSSVNSS